MDKFINPLTGRITSKFGTRIHPFTKEKSFHNGVDISVPKGTAIVAPADGIITEVWDHKHGGRSLAMLSDSRVRFGFAHLDKRMVAIHTRVKAGEKIAESGNTGRSTNPHLHFTVTINGLWVDPQAHFTFK